MHVRYFVGGLHPRFQIAAICQHSSPGFLAQINDLIRGITRLFENRAIVGSLVLRAQKQRLYARLSTRQQSEADKPARDSFGMLREVLPGESNSLVAHDKGVALGNRAAVSASSCGGLFRQPYFRAAGIAVHPGCLPPERTAQMAAQRRASIAPR